MDNETPFPEDLTTLTPEELDAAEERLRAEAADLQAIDADDMTDEQVAELERTADRLDAVAAQRTALAEASDARRQRAEAAAARLAPADETTEGDPTEDADPEEGDEPAEGDDPAEDPAAAPEAVQPVAASAGRTGVRRTPVARRMRQPKNPTPAKADAGRLVSLVAAADVGNVPAGSDLGDMSGAVESFIARSKSFPQGVARQKNVRHQFGVAQVIRNFDNDPDGLWYGNKDYRDSQTLLTAAMSESRLKGGSLVAAGGWCAPSENMYGLCQQETLDGIIDLPTVGVDRGGINYTPGPDFSDIFTSAGFAQTEAEAIAGTTKACVEVDCPDFQEVRLDAVGICVKAPLLTRAAYPELIQRWLEGTLVANQHKVAARLIAGMRTALGAALAPVLTGTPITWSTLTALEWVIEMQRQAYRLSESESLEVVAPRWLRVAIRADLANRMGIGAESVTNTQIAQHFADRGAAVQWVLNYLEIATPLTSVAFPATVEVMVYPAGTFVKGQADVVSLDTVYDTGDLQTNVYTAAFMEDGVLLAKMCHGGARITLPVCASGMLGAAQLDDCWGAAQVENVGAAAA